MDKTESKLKIVGFVGSVIVGLSGAAVGTWRALKESEKLHDEAEREKALESSEEETPESK